MDASTRAYRAQVQAVQGQTLSDLVKLWPLLDLRNLNASFPAWSVALKGIIDRDRTLAAGAAANYLRTERAAQVGTAGAVIEMAGPIDPDQFIASSNAVVLAGYRTALRTQTPLKAGQIAMVRTAGMATRQVLNAGRDTILDSLKADPKGTGWRRVSSPSACGFCTMLVGRGAVYSATTATFSSHDHCRCSAEPVYGPITDPVYLNEPTRRRDGDTELALAGLRAAT